MTDVDQILRAHADAAAAVEPATDGWDRLVTRLAAPAADHADNTADNDDDAADNTADNDAAADDTADNHDDDAAHDDNAAAEAALVPPLDHGLGAAPGPGRSPGARRWPLVAAAAVLVVVLASAAVALVRAGDDADGTGRTGAGPTDGSAEPTSTAPAPDASPAPTTPEPGSGGRPDIDPATMPDRVVAVLDHDGDGLDDLVRLDGIGIGEDVPGPGGTTARGMRPPEVTVLVAGSDVTPAAITSVDVGPDGAAFCAVGEEVWRVDPTSGRAAGPYVGGTAPAISGDGRHLATIAGGVVRVHHLEALGGSGVTEIEGGEGEPTAVALSPDGSLLARQRVTRAADGTITSTAVDVIAVDDPTDGRPVERSSGVALPAFVPDGFLAVGLGAAGASEGHDEARASEVGLVDLATGEVRWSVGGGGFSFTSFDATPDGRWVMVTQEGVIRAFAAVGGALWDSGTVVATGGIVDAAW